MNTFFREFVVDAKTVYRMPLVFISLALAFWTLARLLLMVVLYPERVDASGKLWFFLLEGVRFDVITLALFLVLPMMVVCVVALRPGLWLIFQRWMTLVGCAMFAAFVFLELVTPTFIDEFDTRPNRLFAEYLLYPKEVFTMLGKGYISSIVTAVLLVPASAHLAYRLLRSTVTKTAIHWRSALVLLPVTLVICVLAGRSTLAHRPVNPSVLAVTDDLMVNSLGLNSTYSLSYALYSWHKHERRGLRYGNLSQDRALAVVKANMRIPDHDFIPGDVPTLHRQFSTHPRAKPLNLVIVLEESLGAEFVGRLGGLPVTPALDRLAEQGLWFDRMYATGTRSVRGIEAVVTGFTPTPSTSVVKLEKAQHDFFTIAELLASYDYDTSFFYGGEAHFDNMRGFFVGNGFQHIVEQKDYVAPTFVGTWGVCDEDLFAKAHAYFQAQGEQPFFSLVFTSSNHTPFEIPDGKITPYDSPLHTVNNAVKYADYALGNFIDQARQADYWKNTLILVVADHNSRVYGQDLVPIERFHIPALILGADIEPKVERRIASQIDLIPTLLSLMGLNSIHPAIGVDLTREDLLGYGGRAMMQFNDVNAFMEGNQVVVLQNDRSPSQYVYTDKQLRDSVVDPALAEKALAHALFGQFSYHQQQYRLPDSVAQILHSY